VEKPKCPYLAALDALDCSLNYVESKQQEGLVKFATAEEFAKITFP
jgi:hypothetical protein